MDVVLWVRHLWIAWIRAHLLKNHSFWTMKAHTYHSWCWKKVLKIRPLVQPLIKYKVGNDTSIFIWHDNRHPRGPLLQVYGSDGLVSPGLHFDAKLSS